MIVVGMVVLIALGKAPVDQGLSVITTLIGYLFGVVRGNAVVNAIQTSRQGGDAAMQQSQK